jgi:hypothetical protein
MEIPEIVTKNVTIKYEPLLTFYISFSYENCVRYKIPAAVTN